MSIQCKAIVHMLFVLTFLAMGEAPAMADSIMSQNKVPGQVENKARQLMHDLEKQGFEVSRGYFKLWTKDDCDYTAERLGKCYGNNPAAPYVIMTVPPWPDEFVDKKMGNLFGPSLAGYQDIYRFDPREAIVILGQLPPPAAYFSEQTWLFTRQGDFDTNSQTYNDINTYFHDFLNVFFAYVPDNTERIQSLSMLSNIVNNVVIEKQSGTAFDQIRHLIITPDQFMDTAVREAFAGISVENKDVFTERIPSDMNVGLQQSADDFTTWFRYAHPFDEEAGNLWRKNLPLVVLRVRDTRSPREPRKYPPVVLETRTAVDEGALKPDLDTLLAAVARRWGQPCASADCSDQATTFNDLQAFPTYMVGPLCTAIGENCLLDTWDTAYQLHGPNSLDNGEIYAVAGTLATETGNATYVGLGLNQTSILKGVADLSDQDLRGTAHGYQGEVRNTNKLFLYYFTQDCSGLEELTGENCLSLRDLIPTGDYVTFSIRDYIKPDTQRGPDSAHILPSMVLKLHRP